jgi:hypothetical protein
MPGALGRDGAPVQLAGQTDGESADVDHFLHFAQRLGGDLAHLDRHQCGQVFFVFGEQLAQPGHHRAAHRGRCAAPCGKRFDGGGDGALGLLGGACRDGEQRLPGDRSTRRQAVPTRLVEAGRTPDRRKRTEHLRAQTVCGHAAASSYRT